jgi:hypothetical protein
MGKTLSTTWPWDVGSPDFAVQQALMLGCDDLCIRATDGGALYGVNDWTRLRWKGKTHYDLERAAKAAKLTTSIWCAVYLRFWAEEAEAIKRAVDYYNPPVVWLDAEGTAKKNIANLGAFLRALGRLGTRVVAVQSYRMAHLHTELQWPKWYSYRDPQGRYVIDGLGHQLYPIGLTGEANWVADTQRALQSHQREIEAAGRPDMPWYPTLPTFIGGTFEGQKTPWRPRPQDLLAQIDCLQHALGPRLKRVNFWSLDQDLVRLPELAKAISELELPVSTETPTPLTLDQRVSSIESEARAHGWSL